LIILTAAFIAKPNVIKWLYGSFSYQQLHKGNLLGMFYRAFLLSLSSITCLAVWQFIPNSAHFFTRFGANCINTYLLHSIIILWLIDLQFFALLRPITPFLILLVLFITSLVMSFAFASIRLNNILKPLFNYNWLWQLSSFYKNLNLAKKR